MRQTRIAPAVLALVIAAGTFLAGCGSDEGPRQAAIGASSTPTPAPTLPPLPAANQKLIIAQSGAIGPDCGPQSRNGNYAPYAASMTGDRSTLTVALGPDFTTLNTKGGTPATRGVMQCLLPVQVPLPAGWRFTVLGAKVSAYGTHDSTASVRFQGDIPNGIGALTSLHQWVATFNLGSAPPVPKLATVQAKEFYSDPAAPNYNAQLNRPWSSPCGGKVTKWILTVNTTLLTKGGNLGSYAAIGSAAPPRAPVTVTLPVTWTRCT